MARGYKITIKDRSSGKNVMAFNVTRTAAGKKVRRPGLKKRSTSRRKKAEPGLGGFRLITDWFK
tara:strand:- start:3750 stop:3941 length:192 start_codon:yes stop_codon:yes gene_type:complete